MVIHFIIAIASSVTSTTKVAIAILTGAINAVEFPLLYSLAILAPELPLVRCLKTF
jgi:fucose permease